MVRFHRTIPVLRVRDMRSSLDYYTSVLGFRRDWGDEMFASVSRDEATLFLCQGDQGHFGTWVWIGVADAQELHAELMERGAVIRNPPFNFPWALEMQVADPDGNVLRMGSEPLADAPPPEWLDMDGVRWRQEPGGGWTRVAT